MQKKLFHQNKADAHLTIHSLQFKKLQYYNTCNSIAPEPLNVMISCFIKKKKISFLNEV